MRKRGLKKKKKKVSEPAWKATRDNRTVPSSPASRRESLGAIVYCIGGPSLNTLSSTTNPQFVVAALTFGWPSWIGPDWVGLSTRMVRHSVCFSCRCQILTIINNVYTTPPPRPQNHTLRPRLHLPPSWATTQTANHHWAHSVDS